ncbi:MAG TPA: VOC family protein [Candidatus Limnocylindria bacterium]|nr:VOC family protein [Candidatus Limnocylindria bacterium]
MNTVTPSLAFKERAEDAIKLYVSVIKNSKIVHIMRSDGGPLPKGSVLHGSFELDGREFTAMHGGPTFTFSEGISLVATCDTQEELDDIWKRLSEGGEEGPCGWLKDRFGVSWQVVPRALGDMMGHPESGNSGKVIEALLKMGRIDIATLKQAYKQR